jgi:RimJ/RimL family protein N-acetyltransferase
MTIPRPILLDIPDSFETERLVIRACRPGDGPAACAAILESLDALRPWVPWASEERTVESTEMFERQAHVRFMAREEFGMNMFRRTDGLFVGGIGLHRIDWTVPRFEIGYWIRTSLQGQGYATEAVRGLTDFTFRVLGAQRIEIRCDARNTRSAAVAERAGYTLEARLRHNSRNVDGLLHDTLVFARLAGE